jgi:hypothetical protein
MPSRCRAGLFIHMFCSSADQIRDENSRAENRSSEKSVSSFFGYRVVLALSGLDRFIPLFLYMSCQYGPACSCIGSFESNLIE